MPSAGYWGRQDDSDTAKIKRTISWYNKHGGLRKPLHYQDLADPLKRIGTEQALRILKGLEGKADSIESPTGWVLGYVNRLGCGDELDWFLAEKISKTVNWYNKYGELSQHLSYREVVGPLSKLNSEEAMKILKELDSKKHEVRDPTRWVIGYARYMEGFMERASKVRRTAMWYNQHGQLKEPIDVDEVIQDLASLEPWQSMSLLKTLGEKGEQVEKPTAWLCAAAQKMRRPKDEAQFSPLGLLKDESEPHP